MNRLVQLVRAKLRIDPTEDASASVPNPEPLSSAVTEADHWDWPISNPRRYRDDIAQTLERPTLERPTVKPVLHLRNDEPIVGTAYLEVTALPLHEQICEFGQRVKAMGVGQIKLVPIFLLRGVHVMEEIPAEVDLARQRLGSSLEVILCPHLGSHTGMGDLLCDRMRDVRTDRQVIVAHGSRRSGGNRSVDEIAAQLGAAVAFWAVPPTLESQLIDLMQAGYQRLAIIPYFLFAGGITDAITHMTEELAERFPRISIRLMPPLGATAELADLVVDLME